MSLLLTSGCFFVPLPSDAPPEYTQSVKSMETLVGSTSYDVVESLGLPKMIVRQNNTTYYL